MRQRLLAIVAAVSAASIGAGSLVFVQWNEPHRVEHVVVNVQEWQLMDADSCDPSPCTTQQCVAAQNHLNDAGTGCLVRMVACDWRITARMRAAAAESGVTLGAKKYQRLDLGALRCPANGGVVWTVPLNDAGWPVVGDVAEVAPRCVRAPLDGGTTCLRGLPDGGSRFFGTGNVFPAGEARGSGCEPCGCVRMAGDSDEDL